MLRRVSMSDTVIIYTDGACRGNPGPGGWGAWLSCNGKEKELFGGEADTTNNRMELTAVIRALAALKRSCTVDVHTDSKYVQQGITAWIHGWKKTAGAHRTKSRSRMRICGKRWMNLRSNTRSGGIG